MATRVRRRTSRHAAPSPAKAAAAPRGGDSMIATAVAGLDQGAARTAATAMLADAGTAPQLRTDSAAQAQAASAGALAWARPGEIGFGPGPVGQATHLHELAHSVQFAGGSRGSAATLPNAHEAEREAQQAVPILQRGHVPRVSAYGGSAPLFDKPKSLPKAQQKNLPGEVQIPVAEIETWGADRQYIWLRVMRRHLQQVVPGISEADIAGTLKEITERNVSGDIPGLIAKAKKAGKKSLGITVSKGLNEVVAKRFMVNAGGGAGGASTGTATGSGAGAGGGTGQGALTLGISDKPGEKLAAMTATGAVREVQDKVDADNAAKQASRPKLLDKDGVERIWPDELARPEDREKIVDVMKAIVGEPLELSIWDVGKLPDRLTSDEGRYLLQIANADPALKAAVIARLKGSSQLKPPGGQTMAQALETAFADVELESHAGELGVEFSGKGSGTTPIENRPVRGSIVSGIQSALSVGERAVWKFEVHDDRDAFRVPHIHIAWLAQRTDPLTKAVETVSSENTHTIPVRDQGILNDGEFDFTARKIGPHVVKAIVHHNFFKPAYFEEPFIVEDEAKQAERIFDKENEGLVAQGDSWEDKLYDHGGSDDYRRGRMRRGKLDAKAKATTDDDLIASLEAQKKQVTDNVALLVAQDKGQADDLNKARDERIAEIDKQIATMRARHHAGATPLVARGQFVSRVRGVEDSTMSLSCSLNEVAVIDSDTGITRTEFLLNLNDGSARSSRKIYHWSAQENSVQAAQRALFLQVAEAYPFGTVSVLFQDYDAKLHAPTGSFVQFEKKTDTVAKDFKSAIYDERVDFLVNVVGFILSIIPFTAPIGIALTVVYNSSKALADNIDDAETGNFESKKGAIALGDLVLNLLPLAPKLVKVGRGTYFAIKASSIAGGVVLMGAVGLEQVRELRTGLIDGLVRKKMRYDQLMLNNKSHPDIVSGSLEREIKQLSKQASSATETVFGQMAAQTVFMHVISTAADKGFGNIADASPGVAQVMDAARDRKAAITPLKEQGAMLHQDGATPKYDYKQGKIIADEATVKPGKLEALSREAGVDRQLKQAGMAEGERAAVGEKVAGLDVDVVPGSKTEIVAGAKGRPELRVKPGATAAEVGAVLKDKAATVKPALAAETPRFIPPAKPMPGSPADVVGKTVQARLSERAKSAFPDVQVEIVAPGEFGKGKTRATLDIEGGKARLRFEGEPRPGMLAEEIAHLEQLADPQFAEQRRTLEALSHVEPAPGAAGRQARDWSSVGERDKVAGHKARLELEADAQGRVIADLEAQVQAQKPVANDPRVYDIEAAYQNLEQLRGKLEELHGIGRELEATGTIGNRPDYLDASPRLANRKTTNKSPPPKDWTKMNQNEYVAAYIEMYPDTTLTKTQLRDRHRNGKRLDPDTGKQRNPNLVDNPAPDVPAKLTNEKTLNVADLKMTPEEQGRMNALLAERDRARRARDRKRDAGDEAGAALIGADVNEASRKIGEAHADIYMREKHPGFVRGYPEPGKPSRSGDFDQVWLKYGGKGGKVVVEIIVIEAKGGSSPLGSRMVDGLRAQQGSGLYFKGIVESMREGTPAMQKAAMQIDSVPSENVQFKLVRAPIEMTEGAKPVSVVVAVEVGDFNRKGTMRKP